MITALSGSGRRWPTRWATSTPPISDLGRAVELAPDDAALRYNRAFAYQSGGRWDDALADLDVAAGLAPDDTDVIAARDECRRRLAVA